MVYLMVKNSRIPQVNHEINNFRLNSETLAGKKGRWLVRDEGRQGGKVGVEGGQGGRRQGRKV